MPERRYTLPSCRMSIDGYLGHLRGYRPAVMRYILILAWAYASPEPNSFPLVFQSPDHAHPPA